MVFLDFEVFKYDWLVVWADTDKKKMYCIVNDKEKLQRFYDYYKNTLMIGYNSNRYDIPILQSILCGFNPHDLSKWIIEDKKPHWEFSKLLRNFPVITYDVMIKEKSLKYLECSLGLKIKESSVDFKIDRKLTKAEIKESIEYCKHDVSALMEVFLQSGFPFCPQDEYTSSINIIKEFKFPMSYMSKTKAQLGCAVLGARKKEFDDEFDIINPTNLILGKYEYVRDWFFNKDNHKYTVEVIGKRGGKKIEKNQFVTKVADLDHTFAWGGVHGSVEKCIVDGILLMCDFGSLYPNIMVTYNLISRGVPNPSRYKELLETRLELKRKGDRREKTYKIALNGSYGQMKYKKSPLYDPKMANNVCVHGQLIALDLIEKLEKVGTILNSNTDGVLVKVNSKEDKKKVEEICKEVSERVNIPIDIEEYCRFIVKDVNNYIAIKENGKIKAKGAYVKELNPLEMSMNIVNVAIRDYFVKGVPARKTIYSCTNILDFQIIAKAGKSYKCAMRITEGGKRIVLPEKCNRVFASKNKNDTGIYKLHNDGGVEKIEMTPEKCLIINDDVREMPLPKDLDKDWYVRLAEKRIAEFLGNKC